MNYWLHCQHLIRDGKKMSKSRGNIITPQELIKSHGADPLAIRLMLLSTHYRKMLNFTFEALDQAKSALDRLNEFILQLASTSFKEGKNPEVSTIIQDMKRKFIEGLSNDLNISASLTGLFEMIKKINILVSSNKVFQADALNLLSSVASINKVLGVVTFPPNIKVNDSFEIGEEIRVEMETQPLPEEIEKRIEEREKARKEKKYALADKIREDLLQHGIILEDTKDGVRWKIVK